MTNRAVVSGGSPPTRMSKDEARANLDELFGDSDRGSSGGERFSRKSDLWTSIQCPRRRIRAALSQRRHSIHRALPGISAGSGATSSRTRFPGRIFRTSRVQHDGKQVSTLDVADYADFTLLTGTGGKAWIEAAKELRASRHPDQDGWRWASARLRRSPGGRRRIRGVSDRGCVLVRPTASWRGEVGECRAEPDR